jgi:hypothetical protein
MSQPTNIRTHPIIVCVGLVYLALQTVEVDGWIRSAIARYRSFVLLWKLANVNHNSLS